MPFQLIDLAPILASMERSGFAVAEGTLADVEMSARLASWSPVTMKRGSPKVVLRPFERETAPKRSLSAVYGLGAQPLHTDGAHMEEPPDVVVLASADPTPTGTVVFAPSIKHNLPWTDIRAGIFTVRGNQGSFLASASTDERIRFDPVVMSPGDLRARNVVGYFADARQHAVLHQWTEPNMLLFIDNRHALHGREAIEGDAETRQVERLALKFGAAS